MGTSWSESQRAFTDATHWFVHTSARVGARWDRPGLGEWDVRSLVGHTSRALLTLEMYLARPAQTAMLRSAADYFRAASALATGPEVAARGRDAGIALGVDPQSSLAAIAARVVPLIQAKDGTELLTTLAGGMRLQDYLPTRTFELTVHTADLARALGFPLDLPGTAAAEALRIVSELAIREGHAGAFLLAATGRTGLPAGFTVL